MPKISSIQTNFTGGELSPRLAGRVDVSRYNNGAARMENWHAVIHGGAVRRPGTAYLGAARGDGRLVPFIYSRTQSYVLEFTPNTVRVWRSDGTQVLADSLPLELTTPYTLAQLPEVRYEQADDSMFLFHEAHFPRWIRRNADTDWTIASVPFVVQPFAELNPSPQAFVYPTAKDPIGAQVELQAALPREAGITIGGAAGKGNTLTIDTTAADIVTTADIGRRIYADAGVARISAVVNATRVWAVQESTTNFLSDSYPAGGWGVTGNAWSAGDIGKYVKINGGLVKINWASGASAWGEIRSALSALVASPPGAWELCEAVWTEARGYPRAGCLHEQRLWAGGTAVEPTTLWGSRIGEYLNFELGVKDDDAFSYALAMKQRNPVQHLAAGRRLFALTAGAELSLRGGNEKAIGPTNIQKTNESPHGAAAVRPVEVAGEILFVQGAGKKVRAMGYSADIDGYASPDRTALSEHITGPGIVDMAYQPEVDSLLYCVRTDGQMAVCAYDIAQEVIGWSRYITNGAFRSVCVVPMAARDDAWVLVRRTVGGVARHFIERFDRERNTDAGIVASGDPTLTWGGLGHLGGCEVQVKADGTYQGTQVVRGLGDAQIFLDRQATSIEAGLAFPSTDLELLPPEAGGPGGTAQGSNISVHEVVVRLLDTEVITINEQTSDFRQFGSSLLDRPPPGYTGDYRAITLSDSLYRPRQVISQPLPFKAHVLAVIRKLTLNDT